MRILLVVPRSYHEGRSRRARRTRHLVAGLVRAEHEADVATVKWWDQGSTTHHDRWTTHHAVGRSHLSTTRVVRQLRRHDPDVVHLVDVPPATVLACTAAGRVPVVYEATGLDSPLVGGRFARRAGRAIEAAVVPSDVVATQLLEAGVDTHTEVVPDPISLDRIRSVTPGSAGCIVWSATSMEQSYLDDLLLALAELGDHDQTATLFLEDGVGRALDKATTYQLDGRVEVRRGATRRERLAAYRSADTFVHTPDECSFATELLWAMGAGCIGLVHMRSRSAAHELVTDTRHGIRVYSPGELVDGLVAAEDLESTTIRPDFGRYDIGSVVDDLTRIYRRAVNRSG